MANSSYLKGLPSLVILAVTRGSAVQTQCKPNAADIKSPVAEPTVRLSLSQDGGGEWRPG